MSALLKDERENFTVLKVVLNLSFRVHTCASGIPQTLFKISCIFLAILKTKIKGTNHMNS